MATWKRRCSSCTRNPDVLEMRNRRAAERRQIDSVQRPHQGGDRGGELSVLHHRSQYRHRRGARPAARTNRSEEHTSELQSLRHLVCRLLLEKKKKKHKHT